MLILSQKHLKNVQIKPLKSIGQLYKVLPLRNATEVLGGGVGLSASSALSPSIGGTSPGPRIGVFPLGQEICNANAGGLCVQGIPAFREFLPYQKRKALG